MCVCVCACVSVCVCVRLRVCACVCFASAKLSCLGSFHAYHINKRGSTRECPVRQAYFPGIFPRVSQKQKGIHHDKSHDKRRLHQSTLRTTASVDVEDGKENDDEDHDGEDLF